eukprot:scaffold92574_cov36-Prasinocladus_malaysianus.AAC.1
MTHDRCNTRVANESNSYSYEYDEYPPRQIRESYSHSLYLPYDKNGGGEGEPAQSVVPDARFLIFGDPEHL